MKRHFSLAIIFCCFSLAINSQININESDFAVVNDTVRYSQTVDPTVDYLTTDTNHVWDFTNLIATSQYLKNFNSINNVSFLVSAVYGPSALIPYRASYYTPNNDLPVDQLSQFLPVTISDLYGYSKSTADSITSIGYSLSVNGTAVPFKSDTIETRYKFPMGMDSTWYSRGYTLVNFSPFADFIFKQYRQRTSTVDGWGSLILPQGTYNVLRVKHEIHEIDSIYQTFFGAGTWIGTPPIQTTEYEWIAQNKKDVLLKIVVTNANGTDQVQSIEYQDVYLGLDAGISENNFQASVYPNPSSSLIQLNTNSILNTVSLIDSKGLLLEKKEDINSTNLSFDLESYSSGVYFLSLESLSGSKIIRITKN